MHAQKGSYMYTTGLGESDQCYSIDGYNSKCTAHSHGSEKNVGPETFLMHGVAYWGLL